MQKHLLIFLVLISTCLLLASENKNLEKALRLIKVNTEITVDGKVDEVWSFADSTINFFQLDPYYNQPTSVKTVAKVLTTDESLFCLSKCNNKKKYINKKK